MSDSSANTGQPTAGIKNPDDEEGLKTRILSHPTWEHSLPLYQSARLDAYTNQRIPGEIAPGKTSPGKIIHGFTMKPYSFGGPACPPEHSRDEVLANRAALCEAMTMRGDRLIVPDQVHSATFKTNRDMDFSQTDAVIVVEPGIPAMVMVADCVPVILYDPEKHIGAVIHAGWRGTAQAITQQVAHALIADYGCQPSDIIAAMGPSASGCCYEVSGEVVEALEKTVPGPVERFCTFNENGRPQVDLKTVNKLQLAALGVSDIDILPVCTLCNHRQWSHRRGEKGRQGAFLQLL